ncbi:MAG: bifunctional metallophosphatase/5'-nucleotidase [Proteobacteria bacterium]|nr:bifunctional metallophosphatase/5'-nucleotidase [Pseudomonadota bacterium]
MTEKAGCRRIGRGLKIRSGPGVVFLYLLAVMLWAGPAWSETVKLTVLHVNDVHAFVGPDRRTGENGLAKAAALVESARSGSENVVFLAAGDLLQGSALSELTRGRLLFEIQNLAPPDAFVLGNHEFDYGVQALTSGLEGARYPAVSANVFRGDQPLVKPWVELKAAGLKIAVAGLTTPGIWRAEGLSIRNPLDTANQLLPRLAGRADLLILLTHIGLADDRRLAARVPKLFPGPAAIVGGHSHDATTSPVMVGPVPVVHAGAYARFLGRLELEIDPRAGRLVSANGRLIPLGADLPTHPGMMERVEAFYRGPGRKMLEPVARIPVDLSPLDYAGLTAEAIRKNTDATVSVVNLGGFRTGTPAGTLYLDDIYRVFPFSARILTARVSGRDLARILDQRLEPGSNRMPLVFRPSGGPGPLNPEGRYLLAGNDYIVVKLGRALGIDIQPQTADPDLRTFLARTLGNRYPLAKAAAGGE